MSSPIDENRPWGRRVLRLAAALLVGLAAAWFFVERYVINVDRYRERVVAAIEDAIGLPASVGRLDLDLIPRLRLNAHEVMAGDGNFRARVERVTLEAKLLPLIRRRVDIISVQLVGLELRLPKSPARLSKRIRELTDTASKGSESRNSSFRVSIAEIVATNGAVFLGTESEATATVSFNLRDVLSDDITLALKAESSKWGEKATLEYDLRIARANGEIVSLTGSGNLSGVHTKDLGIAGAAGGTISVNLTMKGPGPDELDFEMIGAFESDTHGALAGPLVAKAAWREDGLTVYEASWTSSDLDVQGDATLDQEGTLSLRVAMAKVGPKAMNDLAAMASFTGILPVASEDAAFSASNVLLEFPADGATRFTSGELSFHGIRLDDPRGKALVEGLRGRLALENGLIRIKEFTSDSFSLQGTLRPDFEAPSLVVDLQGSAEIRQAHVAAVIEGDRIADAQGNIVLARLAGTFGPGRGVPEDLVVEGTLENGRLDIKGEAYELRLAPITIEFTTDTEGIRTTLTAASPDIGSVIVAGRYGFEEQKWMGRVSADLPRLVSTFVLEDTDSPALDLVLARYGHSTFWADIVLPSEGSADMQLHLRREGAPSLEGRLTFAPSKSGGMQLGIIEVESKMQLEGLAEEMFSGVTAKGEARITFARDPDTARFEFLTDLGQASIRAGDYLEKRQGDTLRLRLSGVAGETWAARDLRIDVLEETLPITFSEDGVAMGQLDIDVGLLAGLFPEGSTTHGAITGEFSSAPWEVRVAFDRVGFAVDSERQVRSINGTLEIVGDNFAIYDFAFTGVNSECVLAATRQDGHWKGSLKGSALDLDWVEVLGNAVWAFSKEDGESSSEASLWDDPLLGEFYVHLDKMYYRRGVVSAMTVRVIGTDEAIVIQDLYLRPYTGKLTGTITVAREADIDALVRAELELDEIDGHIFDEILYDEPGEVHGTISATISLAAPLGEPKKMMAAADGGVVWSATEGSLGKLGFATKLLTALKTVEVINLKVPSLRDEGLTYKTFTGEAKMSQGVMSLEDLLLDGGAYELEAEGEVDFAQEKTDVTVHVHALQSVSNIVEKVPVIGQITKLTTDLVGVTVLMKGSPYDLETVVIPGGDNIFENTMEIGEKALEGVTRVIKKLIPGGEKPENDE